MTFLPMVERELRVTTRRPLFRRLRFMAGGLSFGFITLGMLLSATPGLGLNSGSGVFALLTACTFLGSLLAGTFLTADVISQERREGTLGFLYLTDLQTVDVILGKLSARMIVPFSCLLAVFPAMAVCFFAGGITAGEFWRVTLTLATTLWFSLSVGLMVSAFFRRERLAYAVTLSLLLGYLVLGALSLKGATVWWGFLTWLSPAALFIHAADNVYSTSGTAYWTAFLLVNLQSGLALVLAGRQVHRLWQSGDEATPKNHFAIRLARLGQSWLSRRAGVIADTENPVAWLVQRQKWSAIFSLTLAITLVIAWFWYQPDLKGFSLPAWMALGLAHLSFCLWLITDVCHALVADRGSGALELLLGTRLENRQILRGYFSAYARRYGGAIAGLLIFDGVIALSESAAGNTGGAAVIMALGCSMMISLGGVFWVGIWRGLQAQTSIRAMFHTTWSMMILPIVWVLVGVVFFGAKTPAHYAVIGTLIIATHNLVMLTDARVRLLENFRQLALRPLGSRSPVVVSKLSAMNWDEDDLVSEPV